jgi:hypothetical protein
MSNIKDATGAVEGIAKAVPVYQDLLQPAMKELGKGVHTLSKTVHIALAPVSALVWGYDQIKDYVQTSLEQKLENVPKENIIPPDVTIAGPTLEALRYTGHKEELREMFSTLLAAAMNSETAPKAHPSFVELIKQINVDEAKIIRNLTTNTSEPQVSIKIVGIGEEKGFQQIYSHFSLIPYTSGCDFPNQGNTYLGNLQRLGIIDLKDDIQKANNSLYDQLIQHELILEIINSIKSDNHEYEIIRGVFARTPYGQKFYESCVSN